MKKNFICFSLVLSIIFLMTPSYAAQRKLVLDVVALDWMGAALKSTDRFTVAKVIENEVNESWKRFTRIDDNNHNLSYEISLGQVVNEEYFLSKPLNCEERFLESFFMELRDWAYSKLKIEDTRNRVIVVLTPPAGCIWAGKASLGNNQKFGSGILLQDTSSAFVINHEVGHILGLGHSNLLRCSNGEVDGSWSSICKGIEYGGAIDVMGNVDTTSPLSTYHQWRMGLLENKEVKQSWLNESIELSASDVYGGTRAVFIRDGKSTYWIEYRRPRQGVPYNAGLVIYRTDPPSPSFIDSPNPDDSENFEPGLVVGTDIWMLNLDTYSYSATGRASGSMTLQPNKSTKLYSGNVTLEAISSSTSDKVTLKITRKADVTSPPVPPVTPSATWRYPGSEIIESGYDDGESAIASFEAQIDGKVVPIDSAINRNFVPTYLDPFLSRRAVYVQSLPEGTYALAIRAIDVWGNKSAFSTPTKVTIDRGVPLVKSDVKVLGTTSDSIQVSLPSIKDVGSNLCATQLVNEDGFVLQNSSLKSAPEFKLKKVGEFKSSIQTFDCLGNGVTGGFSAKTNYTPATKASRTGKWITSNLSDGAMTCFGKCTASLSTSGKAFVMMGEGEATIALTGKNVAKVSSTTSKNLRSGATVDVGLRNRVLRITGSNFTLAGIATVNVSIANLREVPRTPSATDPSLTEAIQKNMYRYGFNAEDFSSGWTVLPMARGTTLDDPTLDLCSASYKSEAGRQYRRQVTVTKVGASYLFLSTEVVKYKDKAAADAALAELQSNYNACVKNKGGIERDGTFVDYTFSPLPTSDAQLVNENSRVLVRAQIGKGVTARQLLAFYQFKGEMFTGLYIVKAGETPISDAEVKRWFDAAGVLANRLDEKF